MSSAILPLLILTIAALLALGVGCLALRGARPRSIGTVGLGVSLFGCVLALIAVLTAESTDLDLPIGPPGIALHLAIDPLSAFFLVLLFLVAGVIFQIAPSPDTGFRPRGAAGVAAAIGGLAFALLAADATALAVGIAVAGTAIWLLGEPGPARTLLLGVTLGAVCLLLIGVAVLTPSGSAGRFEAIRTQAAEPIRSTLAMVLGLAGAGTLAGLAPLHRSLLPAYRISPSPAQVILSAAMGPEAIYVLVRLTVDLPLAAPPMWWSLPVLLMGAATCLVSGWRGVTDPDIDTALAGDAHRLTGQAAIGIGLVLVGQAADLTSLTSLALASVLLLAAVQAVCTTLIVLAGGLAQHAAATRRLDHLGGLIHGMPITASAMLAGLFGLCGLPPGAGFAGSWLLFQTLLEAPRAGGPLTQLLLVGPAAVLAVSVALGAAAAVRLFGVAFLGRARTPRAAAVAEVGRPIRIALLTLAAISALLGLLPGFALLLADPAIRLLTGTGIAPRTGLFGLGSAPDAPGYEALPIAALLGLCIVIVIRLRRRFSNENRLGPAWHDGFAPPPAWLPFGDPLTQSDGTGFVPELPCLPPRQHRLAALAAWRAQPLYASLLWVVLAVIAGLLIALSWMFGA